MSQDLAALTTAVCSVLDRETVLEEVQQQMEAGRQWAGEMRQNVQSQPASQQASATGQFNHHKTEVIALCSNHGEEICIFVFAEIFSIGNNILGLFFTNYRLCTGYCDP